MKNNQSRSKLNLYQTLNKQNITYINKIKFKFLNFFTVKL